MSIGVGNFPGTSQAGSVGSTGATGANTAAEVVTQRADAALGPQLAAGAVPLSDKKPPSPDAVVDFAQGKMGKKVGRGECVDLADQALKKAGYKSYDDYGDPAKQSTYQWGKERPNAEAKPGDVLQFEDYEANGKTKYDDGQVVDGGGESRPHHTAIVLSNDGNGMVTVLEQNVPKGKGVTKKQLHIADGTTTNADGSKTDWTVTGSVKCYEPVPKD